MAKEPHDSKRKNELIMGHRILIDIYKGEYKIRREINRKILNEGLQKSSMRLCNGVIVRRQMKNECHHHVQEPRTFCKGKARGVLTATSRRRCLTEERREFFFGYSPQTIIVRVVRMRYLGTCSTSETISEVTMMHVPRM